jgi:hypothetical protein
MLATQWSTGHIQQAAGVVEHRIIPAAVVRTVRVPSSNRFTPLCAFPEAHLPPRAREVGDLAGWPSTPCQ